MEIILIHYPPNTQLPPPWQPDWQVIPVLDLTSIPSRRVARAPAGTPIPPGCELYSPPVVTDELRQMTRADLERLARSPEPLSKLASGSLDDREQLDRDIRCWLGEAHPYATLAPLSVEFLQDASGATAAAGDLWDSTHSIVTIRCSVRGYDVWVGIGGRVQRVGRADEYDEAETLGVDAVRQRRRETLRRVREVLLVGWSPDTPFYSSTIARAETELPITVHRGPITAEELGEEGRVNGSYALPTVAVYRGDSVTRFPERITWSDEESRTKARERRREGQKRRQVEEARALALLRDYAAIAPHVTDRGLKGGTPLRLGNGMTVTLVGPVRMRDDGREPLALVKEANGKRFWMAIGRFL